MISRRSLTWIAILGGRARPGPRSRGAGGLPRRAGGERSATTWRRSGSARWSGSARPRGRRAGSPASGAGRSPGRSAPSMASTGGRSRSFFWARARASSRSVRTMSHLFSASTVAQPDRIARSPTRRSSAVTPSDASQTTIAASARSAARLGADLGVVADGPGDLASAPQPGRVHQHHVAPVEHDLGVDRVAGRAGAVGDDHPLGPQQRVQQRGLADVRPAEDRDARRCVLGLGLRVGAVLASSAATRSSRSPVPRPCEAETARGSPSPSRLSSAAMRLVPRPVDLVRHEQDRLVGERRSRSASSASPGPRPARASTTSAITSASSIAVFAWSWTERASSSESARSTPPVSIRSKAIPFHSQRSARRSRVTPGSESVTASLPAGEPVDQRALAGVREADDGDLGPPRRALGGQRRRRSCRDPARAPARRPARPPRRPRSRSCRARRRPRPPSARRARARCRARRGRASRPAPPPPVRPVSAARRRARSSALAVRKTFSGESGLTTVPMSRPSAT